MEVDESMICLGMNWSEVGGDDTQQTLFGDKLISKPSALRSQKKAKKK